MKTIDLTRMINPLGVSERVIATLEKNISDIHRYTSPMNELLEGIAQLNNVNKNQVIITDGADGALTLIAQSIFKAKKIIIPQPCFHRNKDYPSYLGVEHKLIKPINSIFFNESGILQSNGDILLIASPNNPTGFTISQDFLKNALEKFDIVVFDETLQLTVNGKQELLGQYPNLIVVRSFSKLFGLAGMRIGYVLASKENIQKINAVSTPYKVNFLGQVAALAALSDIDYIERTKSFVQQERDKLYKAIGNENIRLSESLSYCLKLTDEQLKRLSEHNIKVQEDMGFGYGKDAKSMFRVSISTPEDNDVLIKALNGGQDEKLPNSHR